MTATHAILYFDGASRGNPGPSGAGAVLLTASEHPSGPPQRADVARPLPFMATNNVAEYHGLLEGLRLALAHGVTHLEVIGDSELVVRHMTGQYRVTKDHLRPLHAEAKALAAKFVEVTWRSVPRAQNAEADAQAERAAGEAAEMRHTLVPYGEWLASSRSPGQRTLPGA